MAEATRSLAALEQAMKTLESKLVVQNVAVAAYQQRETDSQVCAEEHQTEMKGLQQQLTMQIDLSHHNAAQHQQAMTTLQTRVEHDIVQHTQLMAEFQQNTAQDQESMKLKIMKAATAEVELSERVEALTTKLQSAQADVL